MKDFQSVRFRMQNFTPEDTRQTNSDVSGSKLSNEEQQEKPYDLTDERDSERAKKNWFRVKLNVLFFSVCKMTNKTVIQTFPSP